MIRWTALIAILLAQPAAAQLVAYTGATVETAGRAGRIENATILTNGRWIDAVGTDVEIPFEAQVVDLSGKVVMPGIVDPYYVFGRRQAQVQNNPFAGRIPGGFGRNLGQRAATGGSFRRMSQYFFAHDTDFSPTLRNGITTVNLVADGIGHSAYGFILPDKLDDVIFEPDGMLYLSVSNDTSSLDQLRKGLDPATSGESGGRRGGFGGPGGFGGGRGGVGGGRGGVPGESGDEPDENQELIREQWRMVREGERPVLVNANNAAAILHLLRALDDYDDVELGLVASGANLSLVLDQLVGRPVTLILQPSIDEAPYGDEFLNVAKLAYERGVSFAFSPSLNASQMLASQDDPLFPVAMLVKAGLPRETAIAALTAAPARLLGLQRSHGTVAVDRVANLLVFDGDPLGAGSRLEQIVIEGREVRAQ